MLGIFDSEPRLMPFFLTLAPNSQGKLDSIPYLQLLTHHHRATLVGRQKRKRGT